MERLIIVNEKIADRKNIDRKYRGGNTFCVKNQRKSTKCKCNEPKAQSDERHHRSSNTPPCAMFDRRKGLNIFSINRTKRTKYKSIEKLKNDGVTEVLGKSLALKCLFEKAKKKSHATMRALIHAFLRR